VGRRSSGLFQQHKVSSLVDGPHCVSAGRHDGLSLHGCPRSVLGCDCAQVPFEDLSLPLGEQRHQSLAFISGAFTGASERWSIMEKEAFAVVESCKRLDYILVRPAGFRLLTDHKYLRYMFNPAGQSSSLARHQAHKLVRWALVLSSFPYTIDCLPVEDNVWGDLLSRWGACGAQVHTKSVRHLLTVVSPLQQAEFDWSSPADIIQTQ
jgi:hypothetical protein